MNAIVRLTGGAGRRASSEAGAEELKAWDLTWSGASLARPLALKPNALEFDGLRRGSFVENNNLSTGSMRRGTIPPFHFFIATFRETWLVPFV